MAEQVKQLVGRLNNSCRQALESAAGLCVTRGHYEVTVEHLLHCLLDDPQGDIALIARSVDVDVDRLRKALDGILETFKTGNSGRPVFSPRMMEWIRQGWMVASLELGHADIRSGVLFVAMIRNAARVCGGDYDSLFEHVDSNMIVDKLPNLVADSKEQTSYEQAGTSGSAEGAPAGAAGDGAVARFCEDFTQKARDGKIDPVFGRDNEIRQMVDILARRRKNNPICVGEPGVGKTAVVEGLALRVVEGDVPESLRDVQIVGLDLGLLQAGASVKGEFEKRLKGVLDEVKGSPTPIILFIDEAHTLIGAGGAAGTGDAANLLKPALARGEMKTIAATTWSEYKKYFEKDAALARRFHLVALDEPSPEVTTTMLRGLRGRYEAAHGVIIRDDALVAAADLGARYISGRQHPDKGIDLVDTAAARVKVALASKPAALQDLERTIQDRERTLDSIRRDQETADLDAVDQIAELEEELPKLRTEAEELTGRWQKERQAAEKVLDLRRRLLEAGAEPEAKGDSDSDADAEEDAQAAGVDIDALRKELDEAKAAFAVIQEGGAQIHIDVTADVVSQVVADWTGVPVGNMVADEAGALLSIEADLKARIMGQDHALEVIATGLRGAKAGLKDPCQPMGIFLLVGPSGTGKTETATAIADQLFGGERFMTTINMSEFQEKHTVSRLIGTTAGYVGFGEGGMLTEAVRKRPYSVVLLDEVEKADPEVLNIFYQVFDKGTLTDGEGREVNFANTVIFLTSNLATDTITQYCQHMDTLDMEELTGAIRPELSRHFKPALLARMGIVPFFTISSEALQSIARLKLAKLQKQVRDHHKVELLVDDEVIDAIAARCTEVETGARNVDHIISGTLMPMLANEILSRMSDDEMPETITVGIDAEGGFTITYDAVPAEAVAAASDA